MLKWIKKQEPDIYCLQEIDFKNKDTGSKGMEKDRTANTNQKKPRVATLISWKAEFRSRNIIRGKEK